MRRVADGETMSAKQRKAHDLRAKGHDIQLIGEDDSSALSDERLADRSRSVGGNRGRSGGSGRHDVVMVWVSRVGELECSDGTPGHLRLRRSPPRKEDR